LFFSSLTSSSPSFFFLPYFLLSIASPTSPSPSFSPWQESGVKAAVLLEQAAVCFVRVTPPMLRKYGFHMVLAGNRYNLASQRKHAMRAYKCVEGVYRGKGWNFILDHCNFTLGRLSAYLGSYNGAVVYFVRLLACAHQSAAMQATFLREFLYVVQVCNQGDVSRGIETQVHGSGR
ncbi:unnamed protein product, partial [Closterium sp. NIES-53]